MPINKGSVVPFPTPNQEPLGQEQSSRQIHESVRCIAAALNRSQRELLKISKMLLEMESQPRTYKTPVGDPEGAAEIGMNSSPGSRSAETRKRNENEVRKVLCIDRKHQDW